MPKTIADAIVRSDTYRGTGQVVTDNASATPVPLAGWTMWFAVKRSSADTDADALYFAETGDSSGGIVSTDLGDAGVTTGTYTYRMPSSATIGMTCPVTLYVGIKVRDPDGNVETVATA